MLVVLGSPTTVLVVPGHPTPVLLVLTPPPTPLLVVCASRTVLAVLGPLCPLRAPLVCAHCVPGHPALRAPRLALLLSTYQLQESTTGQSTAMEGHQEDTDAAGQGSGVKQRPNWAVEALLSLLEWGVHKLGEIIPAVLD